MSERRACKAIGCCRMTVRYQSTRPDDRDIRERMIVLARERRRFGYRRLHALLRREGYEVNHKKLFRLYREEKLTVRRRGGRKRAIGTRAPMLLPLLPNERWSLDFVSDQFTDGRRFRILTVVDDCTRECLALLADTSLSGVRVARELDRLIAEHGKRACQKFRVWAALLNIAHHALAAWKRSAKRMANWLLALAHSLGGIFHSFSDLFKIRKSSFSAASSFGKWPLARTARRSLEFSASMALVV